MGDHLKTKVNEMKLRRAGIFFDKLDDKSTGHVRKLARGFEQMLITGVNLEVEKEKDYKVEIESNRILTFESPAKRRKLEDVARPSTSPRAWRPSPTCRSRGTRRGRPSTPTIGKSSMWEVLGPAEAGQGMSSQARGTRCMPRPDSTPPPPTSLSRSSLGLQSQPAQSVSDKLSMSGAVENHPVSTVVRVQ